MKFCKTYFVISLIITFGIASIPTFTETESTNALLAKPGAFVEIIEPYEGEIVSGIVFITVDASAKCNIAIDGTVVASGYSYTWDTTQYTDGQHVIKASTKGLTHTITVTVDNHGTVDNPPVVTITNPSNDATVSGTVTITVTVLDEDTLTPDIYIDGIHVATSSSYNWDTTSYADGSSHTIYAEANDSIEQVGSDEISVNVDNSGTPPPIGNYPWWNDLIDAEIAHASGITGQGSVVVIIDTGLGANYVDLFPADSILTEYCWSQTKALGKDNVEWNKDREGHGTACTATIIGYWLDLSDGTHIYVEGVAPDTKIVMIRTLYWTGGFGPKRVTETELLNAWADAINYAIDLHNGPLSSYNMIVSVSLGYDNTNEYLTSAVNAAEADGIVVATSAGNDGHTSSTTAYPANYVDVTSVAAAGWSSLTGAYGIDGIFTDIPEGDFSELLIADFSSGGKVDVTGIGWNLVLPLTDGYYYISGTSFSCPQTAGVYALMFQVYDGQSVSWLEDKLMNTCYWNSAYMTSFIWGAGFIQADAATS